MAHSEQLAERIRAQLGDVGFDEARIMDGVGFYVDGRMAVGVLDDCLCLPVDEKAVHNYLGEEGVGRYEFGGLPVPGWLAVTEAVIDDDGLAEWVTLGLNGAEG